MRQKLLAEHKNIIGHSYIFDGTMLFLQKKIGNVELQSKWNEEQLKLIITTTNEIHPGSSSAPLQLYNMLFRKVRSSPSSSII